MDLNLAGAQIYCTETAWNRQPIFDIDRDPFMMVSKSKAGIITSAFLEVFKKRADHTVLAYLERREVTPPIDDFAAQLEIAARGYALFDEGAYFYGERGRSDNALDVLDRYSKIAEASNEITRDPEARNAFFVFFDGACLRPARASTWTMSESRLFALPEVTFPRIRRTALILKKVEVGSVEALRTTASHRSDRVLMPHYLNGDETTADFRASIRVVQNSFQAVLFERRKHVLLRINLRTEELEYHLLLAKASGIRAALLPEELPTTSPISEIIIDPSDSYLSAIYLIHFSLIRTRLDKGANARWLTQGRPLKILIMGMVAALRGAGLTPAYERAARNTFALLKSGQLATPSILEM
jgi:hypothetical protein